MIADMHCDTISALLREKREGRPQSLYENKLHLDLVRMKAGGYLLQNFALFVHQGKCADCHAEFLELLKLYQEEMERNKALIAPVLSYGDIARNEREGRLSSLLTVEEGAVCGGSLETLEELWRAGVRMMTLTWNYPNDIGHPNIRDGKPAADTERGLTGFGRECVARMEELGMIVDVSHLSDAGFYDVLSCTKKPFAASHSNARAVCGHARNLTDDMIRALAERGGVAGLNFHVPFLTNVSENGGTSGILEAAAEHARHICDVGGVEVLGLGSDFDGIDTNPELPDCGSVGRLWEILKKRGFSERELDGIFYKNVLRLYRSCLG